ncbi:MAG: ABC transporter permease [Burkholderiales bacterium]
MIFTIAAKELRALLYSPSGWVILALLQLLLAWLFLTGLNRFLALQPQLATLEAAPGVTELVVAPVFSAAAIILLMLTPLLTMRLIAEERRNQTLPFLLSAPVGISTIVLGKFLGIVAFMLIVPLLLVFMALALTWGGTLDWGLLAANALGLVLLAASFAALGLFVSALVVRPALAAAATLAALLALWLINLGARDPDSPLHLVSLFQHYDSFAKGVIDSLDVAYYFVFILLFVALAILRLERDRLG